MLDRTQAPSFVKSTSFHLPQVSKQVLSNGVEILHLDNIQQDLVKIELIFKAGRWFEPKPEVSHFAAQMLDKGTKSMPSKQIAELFDLYGAHIELSSNFDFASVSLYSLSKHLSKLYPIFFELITAPSFEKSELDIMKDHFIQGLKVKKEKTSYVASKIIRKNIFGAAHPYGQSAEEVDIENIRSSDLVSFFNDRMKPSYVIVLGRINKADYTLLEKTLGSISPSNSPIPSYNSVNTSKPAEHIDKESSVQSTIRLGKRTIQRDHSDYPAILILNYYLGGYFGSRLMKNLREDKGLTYGISSSLNSLKNDSILLIGTDVNKENRELAVSEILKEVNFLTSSINSEELELAKRHFIGSLQGEMASPFSIVSKIKNIELFQLSPQYYQNLISGIDSTSADDLQEIANKYFKEDSFIEVTVG